MQTSSAKAAVLSGVTTRLKLCPPKTRDALALTLQPLRFAAKVH
jgi:hypothetical protein